MLNVIPACGVKHYVDHGVMLVCHGPRSYQKDANTFFVKSTSFVVTWVRGGTLVP